MGKITIESASANGKDRRTQVISSKLSIKSKQFKLCYKLSLFPQLSCDPEEVYLERGSPESGCDPVEVYSDDG